MSEPAIQPELFDMPKPEPDYEALGRLHEEVRRDFMREFREWRVRNIYGVPETAQSWSVVPADVLIRVWRSYAELGNVWNRPLLEIIAQQMVLNAVKLDFNTEVMEHKAYSGWDSWEEEWEEFGITRDHYDRDIPRFVCDGNGGWRITDVALPRLMWYVKTLVTPGLSGEDMLGAIDGMLHICHRRSDLASWFVEGGSSTLNKLHDD